MRTRKWDKGRPVGIGFHYTGGPSGLKTMRWFNHPGWGNEVSSCQVLIFDRITDNIVGEMWSKIDAAIHKLFPVPTIILADWNWSTWCTNWINGSCMGVENRNTGYKHDEKFLKDNLGKEAMKGPGGRIWEPYTREQIICNVNLGRVLNGWVDGQLDPNYIVGHSMVCSAKDDPGNIFPMHRIRDAIFDDKTLDEHMWWYGGIYPKAPETGEMDSYWWEPATDIREEPGDVDLSVGEPVIMGIDIYDLKAKLYKLGFNTLNNHDPNVLEMFVRWFQKSTHYYKDNSRHLRVDGDPGTKTHKALDKRLTELRLSA